LELLLLSRHYDLMASRTDGQSTLCQKHVTFVSPVNSNSAVQVDVWKMPPTTGEPDTLADGRDSTGGHVLFGSRKANQDYCA
jgi:hypothetical protein